MAIIDELLTDALIEVGAARGGDVVNNDDLDVALRAFNRISNLWNADEIRVYNTSFADFVLVPTLSPHTIGPAGTAAGPSNPTFVVAQRPVRITAAQVNLGGSPALFRDITVRDEQWYRSQPIPNLAQVFPTDLYYSPDWLDPNDTGEGYGQIFFWGVPTVAYSVRLWLRTVLSTLALGDELSVPPGYDDALMRSVARAIAPAFGWSFTQEQKDLLRDALAVVFGNNVEVPRVASRDAGAGRRVARGGGSFNYGNRSFNK